MNTEANDAEHFSTMTHFKEIKLHIFVSMTQNTATQGFHPFNTEGCYRALLYPPSLLNTQFADYIWMHVYRLQINWEI
jgi:hypothetical protein